MVRHIGITILLLPILLVVITGCGKGIGVKEVYWVEEQIKYYAGLKEEPGGFVGDGLVKVSDGARLLLGVRIVNNTGSRLIISPLDFKVLTKNGELLNMRLIDYPGWAKTHEKITVHGKETSMEVYYKDYVYYDDDIQAVIEPGEDFPLIFHVPAKREDIKHVSFDDGTYRATIRPNQGELIKR